MIFNRRLSAAPALLGEDIRSLTTQERALIQTFPATFKLPGTKSDVEQVIGNAVPVKLAQYVASRLASYIEQIENSGALVLNGQLFESKKTLRAA